MGCYVEAEAIVEATLHQLDKMCGGFRRLIRVEKDAEGALAFHGDAHKRVCLGCDSQGKRGQDKQSSKGSAHSFLIHLTHETCHTAWWMLLIRKHPAVSVVFDASGQDDDAVDEAPEPADPEAERKNELKHSVGHVAQVDPAHAGEKEVEDAGEDSAAIALNRSECGIVGRSGCESVLAP